jgi:hypothetical protein
MLEFVQAYGNWIVLGLLFLLMMRLHGSHGGMGCGMGSHHHQPTGSHDPEPGEEQDSGADSQKPGRSTGCH